MTIQNIEDVMERIMSLNRNLNEESLKTLLSASGWDREDILEGLRIFRATNKNTVAAAPIASHSVDREKIENNLSEEAVVEDIVQDKPYTFSLKKKEEAPDVAPLVVETKDDPLKVEVSLPTKSRVLEKAEETAAEVESFMGVKTENKEASVPAITITTEKDKPAKKKSSSRLGGIILLLLLLLLLLGAAAAYLFLPSFAGWVNEKLSFGPKQTINTKDMTRSEWNTNPNLNPNQNPNNPNYIVPTPVINIVTPTSSTSSGTQIQQTTPIPMVVSDAQVGELMREIEKLKADLNTYKNSIPEAKTQTIVRYVSQKGATGATGRGIVSVGASSTGFVINYTDNTNEIVPYSTSTLTDVLNSKQVCFRDMNATTSSSTDACLDKNTVINLLNR
ncbi:hypothetical protein SDC9_21661 [bioreactor metagenome]|uniref:Uncharacterized protein n=1 Tax=bioreactor metagenome TaxID=1076179 RepID=A0A644UAD8_9ZZZZ|nr:hypothetical protein [Candidatus Elulimicrobiales bacterium]